jgi:hypothetical protein
LPLANTADKTRSADSDSGDREGEENNAAKPFSAEANHGINPLFGVLVRLHLLERYTVFKIGPGIEPNHETHNIQVFHQLYDAVNGAQ